MNTTKGLVGPAGGGKHLDMTTPGRFAALKLLDHETNESVMLLEETIPAGTKSLFHQHRDSDEVAWILAGEITFRIGDEVTVGGPGTCVLPAQRSARVEEHRQRDQPSRVFLHAGRRRRLRRGTLESSRSDE